MEGQASPGLGFKVMRLSKPSLTLDTSVKLSLGVAKTGASPPFADRVLLTDALDACGVGAGMALPASFGSIYLGETFCSYISLTNYGSLPVTFVGLKAELQTERNKHVLYDNTATPLTSLAPNACHDFVVRHDVKELSPHTLVCSTVYTTPEGERKYLPQYFKFASQNPVSVRTKTRTVGDDIFLEACVENNTKGPLFIDYVRFEPAPELTAQSLDAQGTLVSPSDQDEPLGEYMSSLQIISQQGLLNFLYKLQKPAGAEPRGGTEAGSTLGKLEIKWRSTMGERGRLQTQRVLGTPFAEKEAELRLVSLPLSQLTLEQPFTAVLRVQNNVERRMGPLEVLPTALGSGHGDGSVVVSGMQSMNIEELQPYGTADIPITMVPLRSGVHRIQGLTLYDKHEGKPLDSLQPLEVFVRV